MHFQILALIFFNLYSRHFLYIDLFAPLGVRRHLGAVKSVLLLARHRLDVNLDVLRERGGVIPCAKFGPFYDFTAGGFLVFVGAQVLALRGHLVQATEIAQGLTFVATCNIGRVLLHHCFLI